MMGFGGGGSHLPLPDSSGIEKVDRLTLLGLYAGILAAEPPPPPPGKAHKKKLRPTPARIDAEKVRQDWIDRVAVREEAMLTARIGVEMAARRTLVASGLNADRMQQRRLQAEIAQIEVRIKDLQQHLLKLKGGLHQ